MNHNNIYEKPLFLLFSDVSHDAMDILLKQDKDIFMRRDRQVNNIKAQDSFGFRHNWNIQFDGLELDIYWIVDNIDISQYKQIFANVGHDEFNIAIAIDLGANVKSGRANAAIMLGFFLFVRKLISHMHPIAVLWNETNILSGTDYFSDTVEGYGKGGAFPILSTVDFIFNNDNILSTHGLSYFSNQELQYDCSSFEQADVMKRAVRIAHDMAVNGAYSKNIEIMGLDVGERILIEADGGNIAKAHSIFNKSQC